VDVEYQVVEAKRWHCGRMARALRAAHRNGLSHMDLHAKMVEIFEQSYFRRAALIEGRPVAIWGVKGTILSRTGYAWLGLSDEATRYPIALIKEAQRQLDEIMETKRELATTIIASDSAARRFAVFLGFHIAHDGRGDPAHTRRERNRLVAYLDERADLHLDVGGNAKAIPMGLH
jgi:hypothetical protein